VAKRSSVDVLFEVDKADGGVLTTGLTPFITKFGDLNFTKGTIPATAFGDTSEKYLLGIISKYDPIPVDFWYDDAAEPAPNAVFDITKYVHAVTRSFSLTLGGARVYTGELWITEYKVTPTIGEYHNCVATLQFDGDIAVA
jgi:hypothetical protein